jgi:hypothetical protein
VKKLLVIEDGTEYVEFAELFLADAFAIRAVRSADEALRALREEPADALFIDLRFDRVPTETLVGDRDALARRLFGGDENRALRYVQDQQGALILAELRKADFDAPAVFVQDFPARKLANLRRLYGEVACVASFDAAAIRVALGAEP